MRLFTVKPFALIHSIVLLGLIYLFVFSSLVVRAETDFDIELSYRHYPLGGSAKTTLGYGHLIWGNREDLLYGYLRVAGFVEGVPDYFAGGLRLEIFPVQILGVRVGQNWIDNGVEYTDYNCKRYVCVAQLTDAFVEVPVYAGYAGVLLNYSWRSETWQTSNPPEIKYDQLEYVEPVSGLPLAIKGQRTIERQRYVALYEVSESWRLGYVEMQYRGQPLNDSDSDNRARLWAAVGQYRLKGLFTAESEFSVLFGAGEFYSQLVHTDPTAFLAIIFAPNPKLGF